MFYVYRLKAACEMRISDWSSDVCSTDLLRGGNGVGGDAQLPAPVTDNGGVEQQVEAAVERPRAGAAAFVGEREHLRVVDVATDARGRPVDAIAVEAGHRAGHRGDRCLLRADDVVVGLGIHAHVHAPRGVADVLQDGSTAAPRGGEECVRTY